MFIPAPETLAQQCASDTPSNFTALVDLPWLSIVRLTYDVGEIIEVAVDLDTIDQDDLMTMSEHIPLTCVQLDSGDGGPVLGVNRELMLRFFDR